MSSYPRINRLKTHQQFCDRLDELNVSIPVDDEIQSGDQSPLAASARPGQNEIGNRFCILPMEGWDGTKDGRPTELTERRWRNFGISGAKLIWGGEAVAVRHDGRANPNQLMISEKPMS